MSDVAIAEPKAKKVEGNPEPIYKLRQTRLHQGETKLRYWFAEIEEGTPYEKLFDPVYWDVHGYKFVPGDRIIAEPDEQHYTAELKVISVGAGGPKVAEYYKKDWPKTDAPAGVVGQFRVKYAGPHHKWRVERVADNQPLQTGFDNESAANMWLIQNLKTLT